MSAPTDTPLPADVMQQLMAAALLWDANFAAGIVWCVCDR